MKFPPNPAPGTPYTYGGRTWQFDGVKWQQQSNTSILPVVNGGTGANTSAAARNNLGLGNVDNTADIDKPVSISQQQALDNQAAAIKVTTDANAAAISTNTSMSHWLFLAT